MSDDICTECGVKHGAKISDAVLRLYRAILTCTDPIERRQLLVDLGDEYTFDVDAVDLGTPETIHMLADDVTAKRLAFEQSALRLGRVIFEQVAAAAEQVDHAEGEKPQPN